MKYRVYYWRIRSFYQKNSASWKNCPQKTVTSVWTFLLSRAPSCHKNFTKNQLRHQMLTNLRVNISLNHSFPIKNDKTTHLIHAFHLKYFHFHSKCQCSKVIEVFFRKGVLKIRSKFIENTQLYWNHTSARVLSCKFAGYCQNNFSKEHLWTAASEYYPGAV